MTTFNIRPTSGASLVLYYLEFEVTVPDEQGPYQVRFYNEKNLGQELSIVSVDSGLVLNGKSLQLQTGQRSKGFIIACPNDDVFNVCLHRNSKIDVICKISNESNKDEIVLKNSFVNDQSSLDEAISLIDVTTDQKIVKPKAGESLRLVIISPEEKRVILVLLLKSSKSRMFGFFPVSLRSGITDISIPSDLLSKVVAHYGDCDADVMISNNEFQKSIWDIKYDNYVTSCKIIDSDDKPDSSRQFLDPIGREIKPEGPEERAKSKRPHRRHPAIGDPNTVSFRGSPELRMVDESSVIEHIKQQLFQVYFRSAGMNLSFTKKISRLTPEPLLEHALSSTGCSGCQKKKAGKAKHDQG